MLFSVYIGGIRSVQKDWNDKIRKEEAVKRQVQKNKLEEKARAAEARLKQTRLQNQKRKKEKEKNMIKGKETLEKKISSLQEKEAQFQVESQDIERLKIDLAMYDHEVTKEIEECEECEREIAAEANELKNKLRSLENNKRSFKKKKLSTNTTGASLREDFASNKNGSSRLPPVQEGKPFDEEDMSFDNEEMNSREEEKEEEITCVRGEIYVADQYDEESSLSGSPSLNSESIEPPLNFVTKKGADKDDERTSLRPPARQLKIPTNTNHSAPRPPSSRPPSVAGASLETLTISTTAPSGSEGLDSLERLQRDVKKAELEARIHEARAKTKEADAREAAALAIIAQAQAKMVHVEAQMTYFRNLDLSCDEDVPRSIRTISSAGSFEDSLKSDEAA